MKIEKEMTLKCKLTEEGLSCKIDKKDCRHIKEEGIGINGPILNIKRICPIEKPIEVLTKW